MESNPSRSTDFGPNQRIALALAGTVPVPSPVPASGRVYLGINPQHDESLIANAGSPRFFLKVIQKVSAKQVITRIFALAELRAVSLLSTLGEGEGYEARQLQPVEEFHDQLLYAKARLEEAATRAEGVYDLLLFHDAVLYVREAAPVLVRIQYEFGVTAAESAENVEIIEKKSKHCCRLKPTPDPTVSWDVVSALVE